MSSSRSGPSQAPQDGRRKQRVFMPRRRNVQLTEQAGQILIAGLGSASLSTDERRWLERIRPGGIILFRRNIEEAAQVAALLRDADKLGTTPLFRCVDLEGGLVDRLRDVIHPMPSAAAVFATGKRNLYRQHGWLIAREARALGFNVVLAPVLDLGLPESASILRTRAVAVEPWRVIDYARYFVSGLNMENMLGCGKHFPGLGGATVDSHQSTPVIHRQTRLMWRTDLAPWLAVGSRLPFAMVAHASYPWPGRDEALATVSRYWVTNVLRRQVRFRGIILSDDMEMGGILSQMSIEEAVVQAVGAGIQMIEICRDPALILRAYEALMKEAEQSRAFRELIASAWRKIYRSKKKWLHPLRRQNLSRGRISRLCEEVREFADRVGEVPVHSDDPVAWAGKI
ncbi:MAG TPA: beta-N-acetylhexosaminidase [Acidobacteriaceae bacterium]|jgi:beta-N-acetylhexosaminidase|nr:beta-N-acetylhexosaminidase [Acidobacteriaceae bacterium]